MRNYKISNGWLPPAAIMIFALFLVAYSPVISGLFSLKNDAFTGYFAPKYIMSSFLQSGHMPLWNPYINFGFPQYGDMSSGYWNPVSWLIAGTAGYNVYTFTFELLSYILLAGFGCFSLCRYLKLLPAVSLVAAMSYMCCGYFVGHLQHFNWISGAAFLPVCILVFSQFLSSYSLKNVIKAVLVFYFFISSSHPGLIIAAVYFFAAFTIYHVITERKFNVKSLKPFLSQLTLFVVLLLLLSSAMIVSYLDITPHISRGEKIDIASSLLEPTGVKSWLSFLLPFSTVKNQAFFGNDISMRNCYIGLTLFVFLIHAFISNVSRIQKFYLIAGLFFLLLASGGFLKTIAYYAMPFIGYVRLNGEFRIFALLFFMIAASISLDKFLRSDFKNSFVPSTLLNTILIIFCGAVVTGILGIIIQNESLIYSTTFTLNRGGFIETLKEIIDGLSFWDTLLIQGVVQIFFMLLLKKILQQKNKSKLVFLVFCDLLVAVLLNMPYTGVGKTPLKTIHSIHQNSPAGIPLPTLTPLQKIVRDTVYDKLIGAWSMYDKQPGTISYVPYPISLKTETKFFDSTGQTMKSITEKPIAYLLKSPEAVKLISFTGNSFDFDVSSTIQDTLIVQQNFYKYWKYGNDSFHNAFSVNGLIGVPILAGHATIHLEFKPDFLRIPFYISAVVLLVMLIFLLLPARVFGLS